MSLLNFLNESKSKERTFDDISNLVNKNSSNLIESDPDLSLPISAEEGESGWQIKTNPEIMIRTYDFDNLREVLFFVNEIYKYSIRIKHTIKILIDDLSVTVSTTTHDYGGVTSQDKKIVSMANELYSDTRYFKDGV